MKISKVIRTTAVCVASLVALAGLASHGLSLSTQSGTVDHDFIALSQTANQSIQVANKSDETVTEWQFTVRERPPKCRFVD